MFECINKMEILRINNENIFNMPSEAQKIFKESLKIQNNYRDGHLIDIMIDLPEMKEVSLTVNGYDLLDAIKNSMSMRW